MACMKYEKGFCAREGSYKVNFLQYYAEYNFIVAFLYQIQNKFILKYHFQTITIQLQQAYFWQVSSLNTCPAEPGYTLPLQTV